MIRDTKTFVEAERRAVSSLSSAIGSLAVARFLKDDPGALRAFVEEIATGRPNAIRTMEALSSDLERLEEIVDTLSEVRSRLESQMETKAQH